MEIVPHGLKQTIGNTTTITQNDAEQNFNLDLPGRADVPARSLAHRSVAVDCRCVVRRARLPDQLSRTAAPEQTMSSFLPNVIVAPDA